MRKIEQQMNAAIAKRINWQASNTKVEHEHFGALVLLHGNLIAIVSRETGRAEVVLETLRRWDTPTTKSRLRALGVNVYTRKGQTYVNGQPI